MHGGGKLYSSIRGLAETYFPKLASLLQLMPVSLNRNMIVGKLSLKEEAAGKIRVFAMVDPFTQ